MLKNDKIISLILSAVLLITSAPYAFAAETETGNSVQTQNGYVAEQGNDASQPNSTDDNENSSNEEAAGNREEENQSEGTEDSSSEITATGISYPTTINKGKNFSLSGTVSCNSVITRIEIGIVKDGDWVEGCRLDQTINDKTYDIAEQADDEINFAELTAGIYNYRCIAYLNDESTLVFDYRFEVVVPATKFTVVYLPEGGSGKMAKTIVTYGVSTKPAKNSFKKSGYKMIAWTVSRKSDGAYRYVNKSGKTGWYRKGKQPTGYSLRKYYSNSNISYVVKVGDTAYFHAQWKYIPTKLDKFVAEAKSYEGKSLSKTKAAMKKKGYKTENFKQAWCYWFVRTCAKNTGISTKKVYRKQSNCDRSWYRIKGLYRKGRAWKGSYTPKKGDLIFFTWHKRNWADHIGIVTKVTKTKVYTVEGNSGKPGRVRCKSYSIKSKCILGYACM